MKYAFLLPNSWKIPVLILLAGCAVLFIASTCYDFELKFLHHAEHLNFSNDNLTDEVALSGLIVSLLMLAFCKEHVEDEYVSAIRLQCWQWAVIVNYGLLIIGIWMVFGTGFIVVTYYNMLTTLLLFLLLFYGRLYILPLISRKTLS